MADKIKTYIGLILVLLYIGIGVYCLTINDKNADSNFLWRVFGIAALAYGIFRAIRVYQLIKSSNHEKDSLP